MAELPPELTESDWPGASWFAKLRTFLMASRLSVARGSGLSLRFSAGGMILSYDPGLLPGIAVTTSSLDGFNASTGKLGKGSFSLRRIKVTGSGEAYLVAVGGPDVPGYNLDTAALASGRLIQYKIRDNVRVVDVNYCTTS